MEKKAETNKTVMAKYIPIITASFLVAFLVPNPVVEGEITSHLSGIAVGVGFAYLLMFVKKWRSLNEKHN
ncbi:MAG: hypothetical protein GW898_10400 [Thiomicrospira sp.]|nr:hypothetical protein [Thiomicrospira sp.]NCN66313.1 hypothetical protein [Thiomicrospira sp.]NCO14766.1 hypothetical protein [Thiomicrospira sp.]NCO82363.1 hypothetical protein [Thiomicrospira sp.]OIP95508.1 MAG: hypothetical protein AUK56_05555 [Thiomicrospira sp. CG2_30_44_34]